MPPTAMRAMTGRPGCAVVTAGPGTTDAVTGIANAFRAESPMLLIGGQGALSQHKMGSLQDLPHVDILPPITKFAATVPTTERIADMITMAFRECYHGAPGPSYLEIPRDILDAKVRVSRRVSRPPATIEPPPSAFGDPADIERLADILVRAKKPCVLLGTQVWTCRGTDAAIDVRQQPEHSGLYERRRPRDAAAGRPAPLQQTRRYAFDKADVIIIVGTPFDFRMGYGRRLREDATVVQIDMDYRTVGKNRDISLGLVGDVGRDPGRGHQAAASGRVDNGADERKPWMEELRAGRRSGCEKLLPQAQVRRAPIHPYRLALRNQRIPHRGLDLHRRWRRRRDRSPAGVVQPHAPGHWMDPGPLGTLGVGVPFAMAAKFAQPGRRWSACFGDGAFTLTGWDFETLVRFNLPFVGIVGNNSAMNQIRYGQLQIRRGARRRRQHSSATCRFDQFAEMLGGYGEEVRDPAATSARRCERARESGKPSLINVWVDPDVYAPGTMNQTMYK